MMSRYVQPLEERALFSSTPVGIATDVATFKTNVTAFKNALVQAAPTVAADLKALASDVHGLPGPAQNHALIGKLHADEARASATLKADAAAMLSTGGAKVTRTIVDGIHLLAHPTTALAGRFAADLQALQVAESGLVSRFAADTQAAGAKVSADMTALANANPSATALQSDLSKTQSDFSAMFANLQTHFQAAHVDFQKLLSDLNVTL